MQNALDEMSKTVEYRVVDEATGQNPSSTLTSIADAEKSKENREKLWPEDGPQQIQVRVTYRTDWWGLD